MKKLLLLLVVLFVTNALADTTAKIDKILMFEGGNLVYIYPETFGVRSRMGMPLDITPIHRAKLTFQTSLPQ
ncbi:hypothetical protein AEST_02750 [Alishewanella aestuarii B11]|jgi:hypothetical protein|uniref:Uncharacterized protein n=1 Tax=Alishewanella aestuarii B11 TaxID=1197174 RepID=J2IIV3_9ALTE|nr:hypothetical protein [Alishewanella aestuarii]EJI86729.1 hypothetical protein AEST_02750 [Alishewanella aestuarii B11]